MTAVLEQPLPDNLLRPPQPCDSWRLAEHLKTEVLVDGLKILQIGRHATHLARLSRPNIDSARAVPTVAHGSHVRRLGQPRCYLPRRHLAATGTERYAATMMRGSNARNDLAWLIYSRSDSSGSPLRMVAIAFAKNPAPM